MRHQSVSHRKNEFVRKKTAACCSWTSNCKDPHRHCGQLLEACKSNHAIVCVQFPRPVRHQQSHLDICPSVAMALGISDIRRFSDVFDWQNLSTDVTKPWRKRTNRFHVPKPWPRCHFVKRPAKTINGIVRHDFDKTTSFSLKNAKRHKIHKHQKSNAATFKYPPGGIINHGMEFRVCIFRQSRIDFRFSFVSQIWMGFLVGGSFLLGLGIKILILEICGPTPFLGKFEH